MARRALFIAFVALAAGAGGAQVALAHQAVGPSASAVATSWSFEPAVVLPLVLFAWLYDIGVRRLWVRFGHGHAIRPWQVGAFAGAMLLLVVALISPLDGLAATLFSAHMVQHMVLVLAIPPLLLLARIDLALPAALPSAWQHDVRRFLRRRPCRAVTHVLMHPATAWWMFAIVFWAWHVPEPYQLALRHDSVHALEHVTLLLVALAFWQVVLRTAGQRAFGFQFAILFVFAAMLQMSLLAAMLTFSSGAWYPHYGAAASEWGIGLLTDQRIGALIMWMTSNAVFFGMIALLFVRWFAVEERRADRAAIAG